MPLQQLRSLLPLTERRRRGRDAEGFRAYNVGTGLGTDVNQLERGLRQALGDALRRQGREENLPVPVYGPPRTGDLCSSLLDAGKILRELGWQPQVTLAEWLKRTAAWFAGREVGF